MTNVTLFAAFYIYKSDISHRSTLVEKFNWGVQTPAPHLLITPCPFLPVLCVIACLVGLVGYVLIKVMRACYHVGTLAPPRACPLPLPIYKCFFYLIISNQPSPPPTLNLSFRSNRCSISQHFRFVITPPTRAKGLTDYDRHATPLSLDTLD